MFTPIRLLITLIKKVVKITKCFKNRCKHGTKKVFCKKQGTKPAQSSANAKPKRVCCCKKPSPKAGE